MSTVGNTSGWLQSFKSEVEFQEKLKNERFLNTDFSMNGPIGKTICFTGGKGGVGKTTLALKFAWELAQENKKVLVIDCDFNLSNTFIKLGIPVQYTIEDLIHKKVSFEECLYKQENFHLLPASNGNLDVYDNESTYGSIILEIAQLVERRYDYIIFDCPAGLSKDLLTINAFCDSRILIVNPDKSSITDSYSLVKILRKRFGIKENHLIVNRIENKKQFLKVVKTLSETIEEFLQCRTIILGGVKTEETTQENFDNFFLSDKKLNFHKNMCKVLKRYTEQHSETLRSDNNNYYLIKKDREQDVHSL